MPQNTTTTSHGELTCRDAEALLADAQAENARLEGENAVLAEALDATRRDLENARGAKRLAIDEAMAARDRADA